MVTKSLEASSALVGYFLVTSDHASIRHLDVAVGRGAHGVGHEIAEHDLTSTCLGSVGIEHRHTGANDLAKFFVKVALIALYLRRDSGSGWVSAMQNVEGLINIVAITNAGDYINPGGHG
ncbi:MAG: hypothetical protein OSB69_21110, partial [Alphaproteobacteria bacterium]|nr:hypothetical protein [Alphaproteobacteria bacterium]